MNAEVVGFEHVKTLDIESASCLACHHMRQFSESILYDLRTKAPTSFVLVKGVKVANKKSGSPTRRPQTTATEGSDSEALQHVSFFPSAVLIHTKPWPYQANVTLDNLGAQYCRLALESSATLLGDGCTSAE